MNKELHTLVAALERLIPHIESGDVAQLLRTANAGYLTDAELRRLPRPAGVAIEDLLGVVELSRELFRHVFLPEQWAGYPSWVNLTEQMTYLIHRVDMAAASPATRHLSLPRDEIYRVRNRLLVEETVATMSWNDSAFDSETARSMLRNGSKPVGEAQQRTVRLYEVLARTPELAMQPLTPARIIEIQSMLEYGLDESNAPEIPYRSSAHPSPAPEDALGIPHAPIERIESDLSALCEFLESDEPSMFVHPLVRVLFGHHWLNAIRPFDRLDGELKRVCSHIFLSRKGYKAIDLSAFMHIKMEEWTKIVVRFSEQGPPDLTRFILAHLELIERSVRETHARLESAADAFARRQKRFEGLSLNHRQNKILARALREPHASFNIRRHSRDYGLSHETARHDLMSLVDVGYFERGRHGRVHVFFLKPSQRAKLEEATR